MKFSYGVIDLSRIKPSCRIVAVMVAAVAAVPRIAETLAQQPLRLCGNKLINFAGDPQRHSATQSLKSLKLYLSDPRLSAFKKIFKGNTPATHNDRQQLSMHAQSLQSLNCEIGILALSQLTAGVHGCNVIFFCCK